MVLYFNWIITSNQITYYLPINRDNFLQIQYDFHLYDLQIHYQLMIACYWKNMYQELNEVNAWNVTVWSITVNVY